MSRPASVPENNGEELARARDQGVPWKVLQQHYDLGRSDCGCRGGKPRRAGTRRAVIPLAPPELFQPAVTLAWTVRGRNLIDDSGPPSTVVCGPELTVRRLP